MGVKRDGIAIAVSALRKTYGRGGQEVHALHDVDLSVRSGERLCVLGPSGSGKSTLIHVLAGLVRPDAGSVRLGDTDLGSLGDDELLQLRRRSVGVVLQDPVFPSAPDVASHITSTASLDGHADRFGAIVDALGLRGCLHRDPAQLSAGEARRVAFAQILFAEPPFVLADEPTGDLDERGGEEVLSLLSRHCGDRGVTAVLATHDLRTCSYVDRVIVLREGRIVDDVSARRS